MSSNKEELERIYQEVVVDDVYQIDKYKPTHVIDIGAYAGHVFNKSYKYATNYYGFDKKIDIRGEFVVRLNSTFMFEKYVTSSADLFDVYHHISFARSMNDINSVRYRFVSMLKIDIQGAEKELLFNESNARIFNHGSIDIIAMEWHYPNEIQDLLALLSDKGFEPVSVKKHKDTMDEMDTYIVIAESTTYQGRQ